MNDEKKLEMCKYIQNNISKLCQTENDEIFKILYKNKSTYTQNNNGIFVNLNWIDEDILNQIYNYVCFCLKSQSEINKYEIMKNKLNDDTFNKDKNDDKEEVKDIVNDNINNIIVKQSKVSSSMKFYLLKKKFLKRNIISPYTINNNLTHEEYLIK